MLTPSADVGDPREQNHATLPHHTPGRLSRQFVLLRKLDQWGWRLSQIRQSKCLCELEERRIAQAGSLSDESNSTFHSWS